MNGSRIAVTGVGLIGALGSGASLTFDRLMRGERGFSEISLFETTGQRTNLAGQVRGFEPKSVAPKGRAWSRSDAFALIAAKEALGEFASSRGRGRLGVAVGVTTAGMLEAERTFAAAEGPNVSQDEELSSYPISSTAARLCEVFGPVHRVATVCSACSSGANAIVQGAAWLRIGAVDAALVGGTDALCRLTLTGFNALGATDTVPCRPFDRSRAGLTLGEGAGFLLLETEHAAQRRGAPVIAWLSGWAMAAEAFHITQPEPSARVPADLLRRVVRRAGLSPENVGYINAHGTGTVANDAIETAAIVSAFGEHGRRVLVSSSKGQLGHTLGAAGAIEAAITVLALSRQEVPPTGGLTEPDAACALNHVAGVGRRCQLRAAASSSFGFGGAGAALLFEHPSAEPRTAQATESETVVVTGVAAIGRDGVVSDAACAEVALSASSAKSREAPPRPLELLDPSRSRRFDTAASLITAGAEAALRSARIEGQGVGLIAGIAFGSVDRTAAFLRAASARGPRFAPPAEFPHLVPSAASGNASIYLGLSGPLVTTGALDASSEAAAAIACDYLESGLARAVVAGGAEARDAFVQRVLAPACIDELPPDRREGSAFVVLESARSASARGAHPHAWIRHRYEVPRHAMDEWLLEPPGDKARAVIVSARSTAGVDALLARSGWADAQRYSVAPAVGFHESAGAHALAASAALILRGDRDEALVIGWNASRVFAFHLAGAP